MSINSRSKGCRNERTAAKLVSNWTGRKFERTPSSGGLQWKASHAKGDIACTVEGHYCPFAFEVKAHKEIDFSHLLNPKVKNVKILEFWNQAKRDAKIANKIPILMMRYDGMPSEFFFIAIPQEFAKKLHLLLPENTATLRFHDYKTNDPIMIFRSTDFFNMPYKTIKKQAKQFLNAQKDLKKQTREGA